MRLRRSGRIINVTSTGSRITMPGITYYCGSKFALGGISEALHKELVEAAREDWNIRRGTALQVCLAGGR
jgi:short-subunit dehydrogenase